MSNTTITSPTPTERHVQDCLGSLFDLENTYDVPNLVEAVVRLIDFCTCADDPAGCVGCLVEQRLGTRRIPAQPPVVHQ
jgi:hypothetical protein